VGLLAALHRNLHDGHKPRGDGVTITKLQTFYENCALVMGLMLAVFYSTYVWAASNAMAIDSKVCCHVVG